VESKVTDIFCLLLICQETLASGDHRIFIIIVIITRFS